MADHLEVDAVHALPVTPYADVRAEIRSGYLLFACGEYTVSRLIRRFTHSPWSHVAILFQLPSIDRVLMLESVEDAGVRMVPLSKYLGDYDDDGLPYDGALVVARLDVPAPALRELARFGADELGRPYNTEEIAEIAARIALHVGRVTAGDRTYICSELVQACFRAAGVEFAGDPDGFVSPENIWADGRVTFLARLQ